MRRIMIVSASLLAVGALPAAYATDMTASVGNVAPIVASASLSGLVSGGLNPVPAGTTNAVLSVVVTDANGYADISSVTVAVKNPAGGTHFAAAAATLASGSLTSATYEFTVAMRFYDAPALLTDQYSFDVVATDAQAATGTGLGLASFNYNALASLSAPSSLSFGAAAPGSSTSAASATITNTGNVRIDAELTGTALSNATSGGTIPVSAVKWAYASDMSSPTSLSGTTASASAFDLATGAASSGDLWLRLDVPTSSPVGAYTGTLTVGAIAG